jgi:ketopantoate reductase
MVFYLMNQSRLSDRHRPVQMNGYEVLTQVQEVAEQSWDMVFFCMSSTGLRGAWLEPMLQAIGAKSTLVTLQPGMDDREYLTERFSASRLVEGLIPIVSYCAPMPGEDFPEPGTAYWIPPFQAALFSGPAERVAPILAILNRGGFVSKSDPDVLKGALVPGTALGLFINALEAAGWSFAKVRRSAELRIACRAMPEAVRILAQKRGVPYPSLAAWMLRPALFRLILRLSRWVIPFDFETYLRIHFTKVGEQMHQGLRDYIENGERLGLPVAELVELRKRLGA